MLPIDSIKIIRAHQLRPGQFALLHDFEKAPAIVGSFNGNTVVVMLHSDKKSPNTARPEDIPGAVTVISDFVIEADPLVAEKVELMDDRASSLVLKGDEVSIMTVAPSRAGFIPVKIGVLAEPGSDVPHAFRKWRLINRQGERETVLFASEG